MELLLIQRYSKSKECRGFVYKNHTSAAYMIQLTFVFILYGLYISYIYKKRRKAVSLSFLYFFCIVFTLFVFTNIIQKLFQLSSCIVFIQFVHCLHVYTININLKFVAVFGLNFIQFCTVSTFLVYMQKYDVHFLQIYYHTKF